ncbi:MAG TPA: TIM barrel protein [Gemmataceae bacterium]|nr:TIM barrel protein [Gemmataceae bacterium]
MHTPNNAMSRRGLLRGAAAAGAAALTRLAPHAIAADSRAATKGRIKQSIVYWCFNGFGDKWDIDTTCQIAKEIGCVSVELMAPELWAPLKKNGLTCAIAPNGMPGMPFHKGFNNPKYHEEVIASTKKMIDDCTDFGVPSVIAFSGYKWRDSEDPKSGEIPLDEGAENCVKGFKQIIGYAEKKGVTICMEHLNTRDSSHPMKGHPGYQGDNLDWMAGIIRKVGSRRLKLLFDIYHVQIMHGDLLRRIDENKDIIGHVHTAGNPGRGELDENQEIQYAPLMKKLLEIKYEGYVGQEFMPTRDPKAGLQQAVRICDV